MSQTDRPAPRFSALDVVSDGAALVGVVLISFGAWLIYAPAGYIVAGVLLLAVGVAGAFRRGA